jgi:uncharacterized membrane protein YeaQ/YmgE (transglycosylase-associated protein family)
VYKNCTLKVAFQRNDVEWRKKEGFMLTFGSLVLADISLAGLLWWLVVGLIAGFLASVVMRGGGYGIVGDIIVGIVGAFIGGFLASLLGLGASGLTGTIIVAFIGACILIAILRAISGGYTRRTL